MGTLLELEQLLVVMYVSMLMMTISEGARKTELFQYSFIILYFLFANINKKMIYNWSALREHYSPTEQQ